jgi:hypothetical protein
MKEVCWVIDGFEARKPLIVGTIAGSYACLTLFAQKVDIETLTGERLDGSLEAVCPIDVRLRLPLRPFGNRL